MTDTFTAKALEAIDEARQRGVERASTHALIHEAQVHATLALVEQQRINNLLMLSSWTQDASNEDIGYDLDKLRMGVAGEVWEGLGLS